MKNNPIVAVRNLHRTYKLGDVQALRGIDLGVYAGEFVTVKGPSGSGKTTLLNIIGGLDPNFQGNVKIDGQDITQLSDKEMVELRRNKVGFVFQSFGLLPHFSAIETVDFALRLAGIPRIERQERGLDCLTRVGLYDRIHHRPDEMSGGQQQRLCIARAIAIKPMLILADEPTGELDGRTGREILSLFRQIVVLENIALIIATHDRLVHEFATKVYNLSDGQLIELNGELK
jgi:putative ABC transport system ATP-binding protein